MPARCDRVASPGLCPGYRDVEIRAHTSVCPAPALWWDLRLRAGEGLRPITMPLAHLTHPVTLCVRSNLHTPQAQAPIWALCWTSV